MSHVAAAGCGLCACPLGGLLLLHHKPCLLISSHARPVLVKGMHGVGIGAPLLLVLLLLLVGQGRVVYLTLLCPLPHVVGTQCRGGGVG